MAKSSPSGDTPRHVRGLLCLLLGALVATACATVPRAVSNRTLRIGTPDAEVSACHPVAPDHVVSSAEASYTEFLDPAKINLLIWNTQKGQDDGWLEEFEQLSVDQDLLVLQEAYLTGVMTASQVAPASACVQRTMEPLLSLPKSTLISRYPLKGSDETLLVGNIHAVNFTLGMAAFRSQLDRLASELDEHEGPMIVAGDFNSWSQSRLGVLEEVLVEKRLMRRVVFNDKNPRAIFGYTVDHVYYRSPIAGCWMPTLLIMPRSGCNSVKPENPHFEACCDGSGASGGNRTGVPGDLGASVLVGKPRERDRTPTQLRRTIRLYVHPKRQGLHGKSRAQPSREEVQLREKQDRQWRSIHRIRRGRQ